MKVKSQSEVAQSCPTLSDPMDCSPPGSSVHGIFQARVLEWVPLPSPKLLMSLAKLPAKEVVLVYTLIKFPDFYQYKILSDFLIFANLVG